MVFGGGAGVEFPAGSRVDERYEVLDALGQGAMANVYVVRHLQLGTLHALKVLQVPTRAIRERLQIEGQIQGRIRHPNVVAVTDMVEADGSPGLIMDLVRGPPLDRLRREVPLSLDAIITLGTQILLGVQAAHRAGHVHRDLKPANVLVDVVEGSLVAKVTDFGLAKLLLPELQGATATRTGTTLGTPAYMAPEQIRDARSVDERADVFSLGALLYELTTGVRAFPGDDVMEVFDAIRAGRAVPMRELRPDATTGMIRAVASALLPDRDARTASVDQMLAMWSEGRGALASQCTWPPEITTQVSAMAKVLADPIVRSASSSTYGGESVVVQPGIVQWEDSVAKPPSRRRLSRWLLVAGTALVVSCAGVTAASALAAAAFGYGYLQWGDEVPPNPIPLAYAEEDPELLAGRFDLVAANRSAALGERGATPNQCADPRPCLELAAALLWAQDAHAWGWVELAADQSRGATDDHRLARRLGAIVRGSALVDDAPERLLDEPLAVLILGQAAALDPADRTAMLLHRLETRPDDVGAILARARSDAANGRADAAVTALDGVLKLHPDHVPALAARAALALDGGAFEEADRLAQRAEPDPLAVRVRASAQRMLSGATSAEPAFAPPSGAARVAWFVGNAEASYGLGFVSEARESLARAAVDTEPLDRWSLVWLRAQLAVSSAQPAELAEASSELRALAAEPVSPIESGRLNNRADLLDGVRALATKDAALLDRAQQGLASRPRGEHWDLVLKRLQEARRGVVGGPTSDPCVFRSLRARWLSESAPTLAEPVLYEVATGPECGPFGVDRAARAEAWVRWAEVRHAAGVDEDARRGLSEWERLILGTELYLDRAGALDEALAGL